MKLARHGSAGQEKPGVIEVQGRVHDLSCIADDVAGAVLLPASMAKLRALDLTTRPLVNGTPQQGLRPGPCVGRVGKLICSDAPQQKSAIKQTIGVHEKT